jgi:hypothetical protein
MIILYNGRGFFDQFWTPIVRVSPLMTPSCVDTDTRRTVVGFLDRFWTPIVHVTPLKTPFGLLIPLLPSQSHVTTITHNYLLRCCTFTQLKSLHFVTTITYCTLTHLHWLTSQPLITVSNYHTLPVSVSYRDLTRRTALYKPTLYRRGPSGYLLCTDTPKTAAIVLSCVSGP